MSVNILESSIIISGLNLRGFHGVMEQERVCGNDFLFDVTIQYDFSRAACYDSIEDTLNYAEAVEIVKEVNSFPSKLLENVAYRIDVALRQRWNQIGQIKIKVSKLFPPIDSEVGALAVEIITSPNHA